MCRNYLKICLQNSSAVLNTGLHFPVNNIRISNFFLKKTLINLYYRGIKYGSGFQSGVHIQQVHIQDSFINHEGSNIKKKGGDLKVLYGVINTTSIVNVIIFIVFFNVFL